MNVDMKVLEALTLERDIPLEKLIDAIEVAVRSAYPREVGAEHHRQHRR